MIKNLIFLLSLLSLNSQALVVLQYHHISDETPKSTSLSPLLFQQHLDYLADNHFQVLSLDEVVGIFNREQKFPDKSVMITFDDAYLSIYQTALPLLKKKQFPFTVFVNTQSIAQEVNTQMSWPQLKELSQNKATIANHSVTHSHLTMQLKNETNDDWKIRVINEIILAQLEITQQLNSTLKAFAYPYGEFNAELKQILKDLGYLAFGQHSGAVASDSDQQALPRFPMAGTYGDMVDFKIKVNSLPLPIAKIELISLTGKTLKDHLMTSENLKPQLKIKLKKNFQSLDVNCFLAGEGAMTKTIDNDFITFQPKNDLPFGRSRFNCTANSEKSGRIYWFSQPWLFY